MPETPMPMPMPHPPSRRSCWEGEEGEAEGAGRRRGRPCWLLCWGWDPIPCWGREVRRCRPLGKRRLPREEEGGGGLPAVPALPAWNPAPVRRSSGGGTRAAGSSPRQSSHVLTAEDVRGRHLRDPGSLEPVRQGLLSLHTILHGADLVGSGAVLPPSVPPDGPGGAVPGSRRRFFRGQVLDLLDTVNQWLEATVVDVADPEDVLGRVPPGGGGWGGGFR